jgi:hypothetical protein
MPEEAGMREEATMIEPMSWESFEWRTGADRYRFVLEAGGLFATLHGAGGRAMTLPVVAWEGLVDAVRTNRAARGRKELPRPLRYGARWGAAETRELTSGYCAGRTIRDLAETHGRTTAAIESQLIRMGLMTRAADPRLPVAEPASSPSTRLGNERLAPAIGDTRTIRKSEIDGRNVPMPPEIDGWEYAR